MYFTRSPYTEATPRKCPFVDEKIARCVLYATPLATQTGPHPPHTHDRQRRGRGAWARMQGGNILVYLRAAAAYMINGVGRSAVQGLAAA